MSIYQFVVVWISYAICSFSVSLSQKRHKRTEKVLTKIAGIVKVKLVSALTDQDGSVWTEDSWTAVWESTSAVGWILNIYSLFVKLSKHVASQRQMLLHGVCRSVVEALTPGCRKSSCIKKGAAWIHRRKIRGELGKPTGTTPDSWEVPRCQMVGHWESTSKNYHHSLALLIKSFPSAIVRDKVLG